jgi:hypothetical protein
MFACKIFRAIYISMGDDPTSALFSEPDVCVGAVGFTAVFFCPFFWLDGALQVELPTL